MDDTFIELFERREPMAVLIGAHYGVLLHFLDDKWWLRGSGRRLVDGLTTILHTMPMSAMFSDSVEWTRAQVGLMNAASPGSC